MRRGVGAGRRRLAAAYVRTVDGRRSATDNVDRPPGRASGGRLRHSYYQLFCTVLLGEAEHQGGWGGVEFVAVGEGWAAGGCAYAGLG
ncbi:hypothetical protein GCM10029976_054160 [Kribbella albertanoniae]